MARPLELAGQARRERFRIASRVGVHALVADDGVRRNASGGTVAAVFAEEIVELGMLRVGHAGILLDRTLLLTLRTERGEARAHRRDELAVRDGAVLEERAVVLDCRRPIAALVGDDGRL